MIYRKIFGFYTFHELFTSFISPNLFFKGYLINGKPVIKV